MNVIKRGGWVQGPRISKNFYFHVLQNLVHYVLLKTG